MGVMKKKNIPCLLIVLMLTQSCVVYQKTPVPIDQAYNKGKVKVVNTLGSKLFFKNMVLEDKTYFGIQGKNKTKTKIDTAQVSAIYLKDFKKSKTRSIFLAISPAIAYLVFLAIFWATGANLNMF